MFRGIHSRMVRSGGSEAGCDTPQRRLRYLSAIAATLILAVLGFAVSAAGQEPAAFFKQNCTSCHWIGGGRLVGPDLKNVLQRKERDWLVRFILDPKAMINSGDPYVLKLKAEAKGVEMLKVAGINRELAEKLLDFIDAESKLDSSAFAGKVIPAGPYSEADVARGAGIFSGETHLVNGAPPCVTCHTVNVTGARLGGRLGPTLTDVFTRLQGRNALTAWLSAPPTPTMKSIFGRRQLSEDEIKYMVAYLESASEKHGRNYDSLLVWMTVIFCGLGGSVFGIVVFSGIWSNRFRAVRRPLLNASKSRGES